MSPLEHIIPWRTSLFQYQKGNIFFHESGSQSQTHRYSTYNESGCLFHAFELSNLSIIRFVITLCFTRMYCHIMFVTSCNLLSADDSLFSHVSDLDLYNEIFIICISSIINCLMLELFFLTRTSQIVFLTKSKHHH